MACPVENALPIMVLARLKRTVANGDEQGLGGLPLRHLQLKLFIFVRVGDVSPTDRIRPTRELRSG
jgi:hypothetical protein